MARLLYIDDHALNRNYIALEMADFGFEVDEADDGASGLKMLAQYTYDVVLLDIEMPNMNGIEVLKKIRQHYSLLTLPIIMITANNQDKSLISAMNLGANDYLVKPINIDVAAARIKTQLTLTKFAKLKDDFLSFASHDLKKPLMFINDIAEVFKQDYSNIVNNKGFDNDIKFIMETCNYMESVITGFLEKGNNDILQESYKARININTLIQESIKSNQYYARQKQHKLTCIIKDDLPGIHIDSFRFKQVIDNLIGNAIKFSPAGSSTTISTRLNNSNIVVSVKDQGPGLTNEDMKELFNKRAKLSNKPTGNETSTGVGLVLCKELVSQLEGEIGAHNNENTGTTFWVKLPLGNGH